MDGILSLLKPAGMTSQACVLNLRIITGEDKVGHGGTLDPNAAGVLPVAFGRATRLIEYMDRSGKGYRCECTLGFETVSGDIWNKHEHEKTVISTDFDFPTDEELIKTLKSFEGDSLQYPPMYSSIRIHGQHLYDFARNGQTVDVKPRPVSIYSCDLVYSVPEENRFVFDLKCSRGTYVRSLCTDIGRKLKTGGVMSGLVRTQSCGFTLEDCVCFEEIAKLTDYSSVLLPMEAALKDLRHAVCESDFQAELFLGGNTLNIKKAQINGTQEACPEEDIALFRGRDDRFLGTGRVIEEDGIRLFKPKKVFS